MARGRLLADAARRVGIDVESAVGDGERQAGRVVEHRDDHVAAFSERGVAVVEELLRPAERGGGGGLRDRAGVRRRLRLELAHRLDRSEEHTSELQSLMRISYAVFCLKKKTKKR